MDNTRLVQMAPSFLPNSANASPSVPFGCYTSAEEISRPTTVKDPSLFVANAFGMALPFAFAAPSVGGLTGAMWAAAPMRPASDS